MLATLASLALAIVFYFQLGAGERIPYQPFAISLLIGVPSVILLIFAWINAFAANTLAAIQTSSLPRLIYLVRQDTTLSLTNTAILLFCILSYGLALAFLLFEFAPMPLLLIIWLFLLGCTIDLLHFLLRRKGRYLDPSLVVPLYTQQFQEQMLKQSAEMYPWIEALTEIGLRGIKQGNISLCHQALDEISISARSYFQYIQKDTGEKNQKELIIYTLSYFLERLKMLFIQAIREQDELVSSLIIGTIGRISIELSQWDLSLLPHPLHDFKKLMKVAHEHKSEEVIIKTSIVLGEIAKTILLKMKNADIQAKEIILNIILQMEELAKMQFRQDKSIPMGILTKPFYEMKKILEDEGIASHPDQTIIASEIDRVIEDFNTLETVLRSMPPHPILPTGNE